MIRRRDPQKSRKRSFASALVIPTPNDNILYLVSELERAFKHPKVMWSPDLVTDLQRRLDQLIVHLIDHAP
jgi:hypothetical protein